MKINSDALKILERKLTEYSKANGAIAEHDSTNTNCSRGCTGMCALNCMNGCYGSMKTGCGSCQHACKGGCHGTCAKTAT